MIWQEKIIIFLYIVGFIATSDLLLIVDEVGYKYLKKGSPPAPKWAISIACAAFWWAIIPIVFISSWRKNG